MHFATHALFSLVLARAFFAKRGWPLLAGIVLAGTLADLDLLSAFFGPAAYLAVRNTITHSIAGTLILILLCALIVRALDKTKTASLRIILNAVSLSAALHLLLDLFSTAGVALLWPFRVTRYSTDWLPGFDPLLLAVLLAGLLLPELRRLVTTEIGAKELSPRAHTGAWVALATIALYVAARFLLHSSSLTLLESRAYHAESPAHIAALPHSFSPLSWTGIVETESMLCTVPVSVAGKFFDPEVARCLHKPDPSPTLAAAQQTAVAQKYLKASRFPRASLSTTIDGTTLALRSMRDFAQGDPSHAVAAQILLDAHSRIISEQIVWAREIHER